MLKRIVHANLKGKRPKKERKLKTRKDQNKKTAKIRPKKETLKSKEEDDKNVTLA